MQCSAAPPVRRSSPVSAKPARSATRCDGRLSRCARISISAQAQRAGRPVAQQHDGARGRAAAAGRRGGPVADLAVAALAVDLHQPDRPDQAVAAGVATASATPSPARASAAAIGEEALGVLARVRRRHARSSAGSPGRGRRRRWRGRRHAASGRTPMLPSDSVGRDDGRHAPRSVPAVAAPRVLPPCARHARPRDLLGCRRQAGLDAGRLRPGPRRAAARARQPAGRAGGRRRHAARLPDRRRLRRGAR